MAVFRGFQGRYLTGWAATGQERVVKARRVRNNVSPHPKLQSCQYQSDTGTSKVTSSSVYNTEIQQIQNTDNTKADVVNNGAEPHTDKSNTNTKLPNLDNIATMQSEATIPSIHSPVRGVGGIGKKEGGRKGTSSRASPRARAPSSRASPSGRGRGTPSKPADWHLVKKHNIKPDGLVQTRLKQFVRQFPGLGILVGGQVEHNSVGGNIKILNLDQKKDERFKGL